MLVADPVDQVQLLDAGCRTGRYAAFDVIYDPDHLAEIDATLD